MANVIYDKACEGLWNADIDWAVGNLKVALIDTGAYTLDSVNHEFLSQVTGIVATTPNLAGKTISGRVVDATDATFTAVPAGPAAEAVIIYVDTTDPATSRLILFADQASSGLPVTPNGGDIVIRWNATGIATL